MRNAPLKAGSSASVLQQLLESADMNCIKAHVNSSFFSKDGGKVNMYDRNWRKEETVFSLSILILFQPALSRVQTMSKWIADNDSWNTQFAKGTEERRLKQNLPSHCDPSGCLLRIMREVLQPSTSLQGGLEEESWKVALFELVKFTVLWLLNGVRGSGNTDDLMESLETTANREMWICQRFPYIT